MTTIREKFIYDHLSRCRNIIFENCKSDYLFSLDSDILVRSDTLNRLLSHNKHVCSSLIYNGYILFPESPYKYPNILYKDDLGIYRHIVNYRVKYPEKNEIGKLIEVDATGAITLIHNSVCKKTKYSWHKQGEDVAWSESVKQNGWQLYCDVSCFNYHIMSPEYLIKYLNNKI